MQDVQPIRTVADLGLFLASPTQLVGMPERDGVYSEAALFPPGPTLFGGAFDPTHAAWFQPNPDTVTFHIPENAEPGTYKVTMKGRRVYFGEDIPHTSTVELQIGSSEPTEAHLTTGHCNSCHTDGGSLTRVLHGNADRSACTGCHVPLSFELEGPVFVRTHFIHSRSDRFDRPTEECSTCHLSEDGIQRTSLAACMSCHTSYPDSHVEEFGPIQSMYVGGGVDSFQQCTDSCHTSHPESGFDGPVHEPGGPHVDDYGYESHHYHGHGDGDHGHDHAHDYDHDR